VELNTGIVAFDELERDSFFDTFPELRESP